jgi:hypothetical protein
MVKDFFLNYAPQPPEPTAHAYLARPMGSYGIPAEMLLSSDIRESLTIFTDPAKLSLRGQGMRPWIDYISLHADSLVVIHRQGVITSGVSIEIEAALEKGIPILINQPCDRYVLLSIRQSVQYNKIKWSL